MEEEEKRLRKLVAISAASQALKYKERFPKASEGEVLQHISNTVEDIISKVDEPI